jgi:outer membrane protein assembly factor BamD (BamD/ComL family)
MWVGAIGSGAAIGIALASGDGEEKTSPEVWVKKLSDPDWTVRAQASQALRSGGEGAYKALFTAKNPDPEARFRIAPLKKELAPLYGSWKHALEAGRLAFDAQRMEPALRYFLIAAKKHKVLRTDTSLGDMCRRAWEDLPDSVKNIAVRRDWELFLCGEYTFLVDHFPQSALREKALFLSRQYREIIREYPHGPYAPLAQYSLTAGHPYFSPPAYLEIKNPEREIESWPRFLREHPGHPGSDDAAYRLGRAMEALSRYGEAVVWLMRSAHLPDGEFTWKGPLRAIYVLDALVPEKEMEGLLDRKYPETIREKAMVTLGVRAMRRGDYAESRVRFTAFLIAFPESPLRSEVESRVQDLDDELIPMADRVDAGKKADESLYALGRYFYHRLLSLYNPIWEGNRVNYFSYEVNCLGRTHAFRHPAYFESHNNFLHAAGYFDRVWREHPDSPCRPAALYSAATAYYKSTSLNRFSLFRRTREELLQASVERYRRIVKEHPKSSLADDAKKMIDVVRNTPKEVGR